MLPSVVLTMVQLFGSYGAQHGQPDRHPLNAVAVLLLVAGPISLLARRRHPVPVLLFVAAVTLGYLLGGYPFGPFFLSLVVALHGVVSHGRRLAGWLTAAGLYVGYVGLVRLVHPQQTIAPGTVVGVAAWMLVLLAAAEFGRVSRERAAEAARGRAEQARRQASDERIRIAQELHDVLAHNISLINVQAGVALHLMDDDPEQVRAALTAIKQASKEALREVRATLGILRQVDEAPPRAPMAGLAGLSGLVEQVRAAGLAVRTEIDGTQRPLPAEVDLAAFRIIQESLTNVRKHALAGAAAATTATVHLGFGGREVLVRVDDDGAGPAAPPAGTEPGGGNGIPGMRERVAALGGELAAGPRPGGGFRVEARLPVPAPTDLKRSVSYRTEPATAPDRRPQGQVNP